MCAGGSVVPGSVGTAASQAPMRARLRAETGAVARPHVWQKLGLAKIRVECARREKPREAANHAGAEKHARQQQPQLPGTLGRDMPIKLASSMACKATHRATNKYEQKPERNGTQRATRPPHPDATELGIGEAAGWAAMAACLAALRGLAGRGAGKGGWPGCGCCCGGGPGCGSC